MRKQNVIVGWVLDPRVHHVESDQTRGLRTHPTCIAMVCILLLGIVAVQAGQAPISPSHFVPADKNLSQDFTQKLLQRGERAVYSGEELGDHRHAGRRHRDRATVPARRRHARRLADLQQARLQRLRPGQLPHLPPGFPRPFRLCRGGRIRRQNDSCAPLNKDFGRVEFAGEYPDRPGSLPGGRLPDPGPDGGLLALHPAERQGLRPARDDLSYHAQEHVRSASQSERSELASERRAFRFRQGGTCVATQRDAWTTRDAH